MKVLLALDQSKDSKVVVNLLRQLKLPTGSTLILLHVVTVDDEKRRMPKEPLKNHKSGIVGSSISRIDDELHRVESVLTSETLKVKPMVADGIPGQEILTVIQRKKSSWLLLVLEGDLEFLACYWVA